MQDFLKQVTANFNDFFKSLDTNRKIALIALATLLTAIVVSLVMWAAKTQYKLLATSQSKEDIASISQLLEDGKIPYQVKDDGKTLYIPEDQVEKWRLEIAKKGVNLTSTLGYEVFDKQSFGTTSYVQKINKQRAIEGELMKTIKHIRGVNRARVHLSLPESSPFVTEKKPPRASVVLDLDRGFSLTKEEIKGIQSLIASSVDGMRNKNVVIIDSKGEKLTENVGDAMTEHTANRLALESKVNNKYEQQVESILTRVVGEGKVIAKVNVKMDFTESIQERTNYDNENVAVVSEVSNKQKFEGVRPSPQGIPGARSNIPGENPQPGIPETRNNTDKNLTTRNFHVPKTVTKSKKPTADIQKLSVAVMIDGKRVPQLDENGEVLLNDNDMPITKYEPWSEAEIANFKAIVASAVGISEARGDSIVIKNMEFAKEDLSAAEALLRQRENREIIKNLTKYLMIGVLISLLFFVVVRPFIQWVTENTVESIEDFLPKTIEELEQLQANQKLPGLEDALPTIEDKLNPEKIEGNMLKERIMNLIDSNPAKAAQVVREMVHAADDNKEIA
ncbi:MAG: flagellar basal-body MS-ring/collar protein FliF [Bacteriovoracaceae bacterium]|nr:flagellar basal-body MS-ring/collar protein FliF [Bacteriovoracaceae bacterium]